MTPAEARAIVERHTSDEYPEGSGPECLDCHHVWPCDAHRAATAYLASVAALRYIVAYMDDEKVSDRDTFRLIRAEAEAAAKETP